METPTKKMVMIGLPGKDFSAQFLASLVNTLFNIWTGGKYNVVLSMGYSSFVTFARMKTLGLDVTRGPDQKPFNGQPFDVFITIDSDIMFTSEHFNKLVEASETHGVVSGLYKMADATHYACVKDWDTEYFKKNGTFQFSTPDSIAEWKKESGERFMPVSYNGMGFFAITKETLDKLKYPYFWCPLQEIKGDNGEIAMIDTCSEDVGFCHNLRDAGVTVMVDTDIVVGHEKTFVV